MVVVVPSFSLIVSSPHRRHTSLIHVLRWMRDPNIEGKGASAAAISKLPLLKFRDVAEGPSAGSVEMTCPICLSEFDEEDDVRMLPCKHYFCKVGATL